MTLKVMQGNHCLSSQSAPCVLPSLGRQEVTITGLTPDTPGVDLLEAELTGASGPFVGSLWDVCTRR